MKGAPATAPLHRNQPYTPEAKAALALTGVCLVVGAWIAFVNFTTPPWMDEFNTYVTTGRGQSLRSFLDYVLRGQHPFGFEGPLYLAQRAGVVDLMALRGFNLLGVALVFAASWVAFRRNAISAVQAAVILSLYASSLALPGYFGSLRPYFLAFSASIAVALAWRLVSVAGWRNALWLWFAALTIFVNLHYFATIFGGLLTFGLVAGRWREGDRKGAAALSAVSALAASPALILGLLQSTSTIESGTLYYFTPGLAEGLAAIGGAVAAGLAWNIPAGLSALAGGYSAVRRRTDRDALILAGLAIVFFALMLAAHLIKAMLYPRYLFAASGALLVAAAVLGAGPYAHRLAAPIICAFALLAQTWTLCFTPKLVGWEQSAGIVAGLVQQCPASTVYAVPYARVSNGPVWTTPLNPTEIDARRFGYSYYAKRFGFAAQEISPGAGIGAAKGCPAIIWIEHFWPKSAPERLLSNLQIQNLGPAYFSAVGSGIVVTINPEE